MNPSFKRRGLDRFFGQVESLPPSDRVILKFLLVLSLIAIVWFLVAKNVNTLVHVPEKGGELKEGIIGTPRFINPLLAVTQADKDMVGLIYAGLMKLGEGGVLVPDMAESVTVSEDGLTYSIVLKDGLSFHDGTPLVTDDVIFTVSKIQEPALKSPLRGNWDGVAMERVSEREMNFVLKQPYAPFIENLTLGILPRHMWESATPEELPFSKYNSEPVGSGPFEIESIKRTDSGIPDSYLLKPFEDYVGSRPKIERLNLTFYPNEVKLGEALRAGTVGSASGLGSALIAELLAVPELKDRFDLHRTPLPRTFEVFFNQNEQAIFRDSAVRKALDMVAPREEIVRDVLGGYGMAIDGPIPPGFGLPVTLNASGSPLERLDAARATLRDGGWKLNDASGLWEKKDGTEVRELRFSLSTPNSPIFENTAGKLVAAWEELGVPVDIKKFEQSDLTQTVIRPRKYDALLFGTVIGRELDFYSFWHSSQRNDPGLNIALYANITVDSILADARTLNSDAERSSAYERFASELKAETPAIFLFVPEFTYLVPKKIHEVKLAGVSTPSERFSQIERWYTETEAVWDFFTDKTQ